MTDEKESQQPDELELGPEKVADLEPADDDADEVRGGKCAERNPTGISLYQP